LNALEEKGFSVFEAKDGQEGLDIFKAHADEIRLVITDLTMPKFNGSDLIAAVQQMNPQVRSVIMTGFSQPKLNTSVNSDFVTVINKPFSINDLVKLAMDTVN
jgi:YesN/AraC family two-component response regulator